MANNSGDRPTMEGQGDGCDKAIMQTILAPPPTTDPQVAAALAQAYSQFTSMLKRVENLNDEVAIRAMAKTCSSNIRGPLAKSIVQTYMALRFGLKWSITRLHGFDANTIMTSLTRGWAWKVQPEVCIHDIKNLNASAALGWPDLGPDSEVPMG
ncbi:hypothetical protein JCGZ_22944 [Jatropha curcas]|uniref:Uncharacterized protein n=1 Tax=Jatropha curcas TaxID=180498 RepID=A0A067K2B5_JATCU|nr:hypothetical protein JCGZ_22944 [Jatropha curcas]